MKLQEALETIIEINSRLLKNNLLPSDDLLVLQAQEIAIEVHSQIVNGVPC